MIESDIQERKLDYNFAIRRTAVHFYEVIANSRKEGVHIAKKFL